MAENLGKWPCKRGPIAKIMPSDGCEGDAIPLAVERWCDFREFGCHPGNVGLFEKFADAANLLVPTRPAYSAIRFDIADDSRRRVVIANLNASRSWVVKIADLAPTLVGYLPGLPRRRTCDSRLRVPMPGAPTPDTIRRRWPGRDHRQRDNPGQDRTHCDGGGVYDQSFHVIHSCLGER